MNNSTNIKYFQTFLNVIDKITEVKGLNVPQIVNKNILYHLPDSSFGKTWAIFLDENNLKPFITGSRRKQLHDGVHILTGYGTDPIGEVLVQAFLLGAKFRLFQLLLGLGLLRIIYKNRSSRQNFDWRLLQQAYQRGRSSNFDPDTWQPEMVWHLTTVEVCGMYGVCTSDS